MHMLTHIRTQEYLSDLDIIHCDLACRNILVGDNKKLKISDFGMSRYVPTDEVYVPTTHGLLPIRWLAKESIFQREFTSASDMWSYGIVLWEICTMGKSIISLYSWALLYTQLCMIPVSVSMWSKIICILICHVRVAIAKLEEASHIGIEDKHLVQDQFPNIIQYRLLYTV